MKAPAVCWCLGYQEQHSISLLLESWVVWKREKANSNKCEEKSKDSPKISFVCLCWCYWFWGFLCKHYSSFLISSSRQHYHTGCMDAVFMNLQVLIVLYIVCYFRGWESYNHLHILIIYGYIDIKSYVAFLLKQNTVKIFLVSKHSFKIFSFGI